MVRYARPPELQKTFKGQPSVPRPVIQDNSGVQNKVNSLIERLNQITEDRNAGRPWDAMEVSRIVAELKSYGVNVSFPKPDVFDLSRAWSQLTPEEKATLKTLGLEEAYIKAVQENNPTGFQYEYQRAVEEYNKIQQTEPQYTVLLKSPNSEESYTGIQFDVLDDKGNVLKYATEPWKQFLEKSGYVVGELWNPKTQKWEWAAFVPSEMIEKRSYYIAKEIVEAADRGDSIQALRERFMNIAGWDSLLTQIWNNITKGGGSKEDRIRNLQQVIKKKMTTDPIIFFVSMPPIEAAATIGTSYGIGAVGGFLKSTFPVASTVFKGVMTASTVYSAKQAVTGGVEAYKQGGVAGAVKYGVPVVSQFVLGGFGYSSGMKYGEVLGYRKLLLSKATSDIERARLNDIFKALDNNAKLSSTNRRQLDLNVDVENLRNNPTQMEALIRFLNSEEAKGYKIVLGGSASQTTYVKGRTAKDIDIYVKSGVLRPVMKRTPTGGVILSYERPSKVAEVVAIMKKYGIDTSLYDIHEYPQVGAPLPQKGVGYTEKPIPTAKGSLFKYQTRLSEQALRKGGSTLAPLHELRGKDWQDTIDIALSQWKQTPKNVELINRLQKWKPKTEEGTYKLIGESYFDLNPIEAPTRGLTLGERFLRRYGKNLETQEDFFNAEGLEFIKPTGEPFRPKVDIIPKPSLLTKVSKVFQARPTEYLFFSDTSYIPTKLSERTGPLLKYDFYTEAKQPQPKEVYPTTKTTIPITSPYPKTTTKYPYAEYPYPKYPITKTVREKYPYYPETKQPYPFTKAKKETITKEELSGIQKEKESESYNVYAKKDATKNAHWVKVGSNLPLQEALSRGSEAVDETVSRTFKVEGSNQPAKPKGYSGWANISYKFRQPVSKKPGYYVEKTTHAIDSQGEHEGITVKGWLALKNRERTTTNVYRPRPIQTTTPTKTKRSRYAFVNPKPFGMYKPEVIKL